LFAVFLVCAVALPIHRVQLDVDAGGRGWFIDSSGVPTADCVDLFTVILHEMGHAIGLHDPTRRRTREDIMYGYLTEGERRVAVSPQEIEPPLDSRPD
jgi:hypothetical protein